MQRVLHYSRYLAVTIALLGVVLALVHIGLHTIGQQKSSHTATSGFFAGASGEHIRLIKLHGPIFSSENVGGVTYIIKELQSAYKNNAARAILLEINSPGGSVGATKRLYEKVIEVRQKKPVVAWIDELAASGGYYVASACSAIVASQAATVGSIGVLSLHLNVRRFLAKHGILAEVFKAGRYKDIASPFRDMGAEERKMYQQLLNDFYRLFLRDVAAGRKQNLTRVRRWADGRIFGGRQAYTLKMVDELGTRKTALAALKKILQIEEDLPLIESEKNLEFYLQKYMTLFYPDAATIYQKLLQAPLLYIYPQPEFLRFWQKKLSLSANN